MRRALLVILWGLSTAGCGYRFSVPGGALPSGVQSVRVPVFENRTAEANLEGLLTEAVRERYARAGKLGGDAAEATLEGVVVSVTGSPVVSLGGVRLPTYAVGATVQVALKKDGRVLAQAVVSQSEDFPSGADVLLTESNRGAALKRLVETLASEVVEQLAVVPGT